MGNTTTVCKVNRVISKSQCYTVMLFLSHRSYMIWDQWFYNTIVSTMQEHEHVIYKQLEHFVAQWFWLRTKIIVNCCIASYVRASVPIRKASRILCNLLWTVCSVAITSQCLIKTINKTIKAGNREKPNKQRTYTTMYWYWYHTRSAYLAERPRKNRC